MSTGADDRSITVQGSAIGSVLVTGDGNSVTVVYAAESVLRPVRPCDGNPYRGLDAFDEGSEAFFFGRESVVDSIVTRLEHLTAPNPTTTPTRFLAIIGPSGSGKTSLVRAGVVPALVRANAAWLRNVKVTVLRPGSSPFYTLADALARLVSGSIDNQKLRTEFFEVLRSRCDQGSCAGATEIIRKFVGADNPVILVVDQFEELYTLQKSGEPLSIANSQREKKQKSDFIATLMNASTDPHVAASVVITLRSDFLGAVGENPALSNTVAAGHEIVPALSREGLERAITEPARIAGHALDRPTVDRILNEASCDVAALPLVQFALERIWDRLRDGISPGETLVSLGGVGGALASRANEVFTSLSEGDQELARRALLGTVQLGDSSARDTRRRAWLDDVVPAGRELQDVRASIEPFVRARLLAVGSTEQGRIWIELPHEALIRHWRELNNWVERYREDMRFGRQAQDVAQAWDAAGRPKGSLWRSPDLDLLRRYANRNSTTELLLAFLRKSEEQARFEKWLLWGTLVSLCALALIAWIFGSIARNQKHQADARRITALSSSLAANARSLYDQGGTKQQTAALLAAKSLMLEPNPQAAATAHLIASHMLIPQGRIQFAEAIQTAVVSDDGRFIATKRYNLDGKSGPIVSVSDLQSGQELARFDLPGWAVSDWGMAFSHDGEMLAVSHEAATFLWRWSTGTVPSTIPGLQHSEVAFSSDNRWLILKNNAGVHVVDTRSASETRLLKISKDRAAPVFVFSPIDAKILFVGNRDGVISIWNVLTGARVAAFTATNTHLDIAPDTPLIDAFGPGPKKFVTVQLEIRKIAISPDGMILCVVDQNGLASLWNINNGSHHKFAAIMLGDFANVVFDKQSRILVSSNGDGTVSVWDARTGQKLAGERLGTFVESLSVSADGSLVISSHRFDTALVWDWRKNKILGRATHDDEIAALALHDNKLTTAASNGLVVTWALPEVGIRDVAISGELILGSVSPNEDLVALGTSRKLSILQGSDLVPILSVSGSADRVEFDMHSKRALIQGSDRVIVFDLVQRQRIFSLDFPAGYAEVRDEFAEQPVHLFVKGSGQLDYSSLFPSTMEFVPVVDARSSANSTVKAARKVAVEVTISEGPLPRNALIQGGGSLTSTLSSDGTKVAVAWNDWIWLFDVSTRSILGHQQIGYEIHKDRDDPFRHQERQSVSAADTENIWFDSENQLLFILTRNGVVWRWDFKNNVCAVLEFVGENALRAGRIIVVPQDEGADIFSLNSSPAKKLKFQGELKGVSPDSKWLAVERFPDHFVGPYKDGGLNAGDFKIDFISSETGKVVKSFSLHASVDYVRFGNDGLLVAVRCSDSSIRIFNLGSGMEFDRIDNALGSPPLFFDHSKALLSVLAGNDKPTTWRLGPDELLHEICSKSVRDLKKQEWQEFLPGEPVTTVCPGR